MRRERSDVVFGEDEVLDVSAALRLREVLAITPAGTELHIDLSRARECHDAAVAVLADAVARQAGVAVEVVGLRPHHHRMLRYMGMGAAATGSAMPAAHEASKLDAAAEAAWAGGFL